MLRIVGGEPYHCVRPHPYVTASREMMLVFELPPGIKDLGWRIRVADGPRELCEVLRWTTEGTPAAKSLCRPAAP